MKFFLARRTSPFRPHALSFRARVLQLLNASATFCGTATINLLLAFIESVGHLTRDTLGERSIASIIG